MFNFKESLYFFQCLLASLISDMNYDWLSSVFCVAATVVQINLNQVNAGKPSKTSLLSKTRVSH